VPYYVDDACFDDGTGGNPGPHVMSRSADEPMTWGFADDGGKPVAVAPAPAPADRFPGRVVDGGHRYDGQQSYQRRCWNYHLNGTPYNIAGTATYDASKPAERPDPAPDPTFGPQGDVRYLQGDVGTHGLHLMFTGDSDNADATVPLTEIDSIDNQLILPPNVANVGAAASQPWLTPIEPVVTPFGRGLPAAPQPHVAGAGLPDTPVTGGAGTGSSNPSATDSLLPDERRKVVTRHPITLPTPLPSLLP
jgi:hypothetical protein